MVIRFITDNRCFHDGNMLKIQKRRPEGRRGSYKGGRAFLGSLKSGTLETEVFQFG